MEHQEYNPQYPTASFSGNGNKNNFHHQKNFKKNKFTDQYQGSQAQAQQQQVPLYTNMIQSYGNPQSPIMKSNFNQNFNNNLDNYGSGSYHQNNYLNYDGQCDNNKLRQYQQQSQYVQFPQQQKQHFQSYENDQQQQQQQQQQVQPQESDDHTINVLPYEFKASAGQEWRRQQFIRDQNYQRKLRQENTEFDLIDYIKNVSNNNERDFNGLKMNLKWANKVQTSEWLLESPRTFDDWFIIPCPCGKRVLLVAFEGKTEVYNKKGLLIEVLKTAIPGSRPGDLHSADSASVLEAIYIPSKKKYFILDVLAYDGVTMMNTKTWCRLSFLMEKFTEDKLQFNYNDDDDDGERGVILDLLYAYELSDQLYPKNCFMTYPYWPQNQPFLGGFLFYHKYSTYILGKSNPLVCWLLPYMVPEVLELQTNVKYMTCRPLNYVDMRTDVIQREMKKYKQQEKKNAKKKINNNLQKTS